VKKKHRVTYDSTLNEGFLVFKADGTARTFRPSKKGLFFSDVKNEVAHAFINTIENNKTKYSIKAYSDAVHARSLQNIIGRPNTQDYIKYVERNMIPNCPVNKADILHAEDIFGANVGSLQGKTVRQQSPRIVTTIHELPTEIAQRHGEVTIEADIMYINGIPFVVTTSRHIHFCTAELIKNEKSATIATAIKQVTQIYHRRGFKVKFLLGDGQFEHIQKFFADTDITINITGRNEHVPAIERAIRTIKERIRAIVNQLPFKYYPNRLIVKMVYNVVFWLNVFPHRDGVHEFMSPRTILTGLHINHDKHCTLEFGTYVQIHEEHDNSMMARTSGAIALRLTGNIQGTHYFLNVNSGRRVTRNFWTALPMPNEIIHAVHRLAAVCKKHKGIVFTDNKGNIIDDNSPELETETQEITGVGNTDNTTDGNITHPVSSTGVYDSNSDNTHPASSTGVYNNTNMSDDNTEDSTNRNMNENDDTPEAIPEPQEIPELQETHTAQETEDDDITYVTPTRHELETLEAMNTTNMSHSTDAAIEHTNTEIEHVGTTDQTTEGHEEHTEAGNSTSHGYNLHPRPTRRHN